MKVKAKLDCIYFRSPWRKRRRELWREKVKRQREERERRSRLISSSNHINVYDVFE